MLQYLSKHWFPLTLALIVLLKWGTISSFFIAPQDHSAYQTQPIILYSTAWCGYCKRMRNFLEQSNLTVIELDIETSLAARQAYNALNGQGIPITVVNGVTIRGYNTSAVIKALKQTY